MSFLAKYIFLVMMYIKNSIVQFIWLPWGLDSLICVPLRDLVLLGQFKKCEKYPWRSVNFSRLKPATLLKLTLLYGCFSCFLNCTNGTKLRNTPHLLKLPVKLPCWRLSADKRIFKFNKMLDALNALNALNARCVKCVAG